MRQRNEKGLFTHIPESDRLKAVTIRLLKSQLEKIKAVAAARGKNYNELIRDWIDNLKD